MKPETHSFYGRRPARDRAHRRAPRRGARARDASPRDACLSPFHFPPRLPRHGGRDAARADAASAARARGVAVAALRRAVTAIAFDAGYETHEAFTRAFRAATRLALRLPETRYPRIELAATCGVHFTPDGGGARIHSPRFRRTHHGCRDQKSVPSCASAPCATSAPTTRSRSLREARRARGTRRFVEQPGAHARDLLRRSGHDAGERAPSDAALVVRRRSDAAGGTRPNSASPAGATRRRLTSARTSSSATLGALHGRVASRERQSHRRRPELRDLSQHADGHAEGASSTPISTSRLPTRRTRSLATSRES